jgi:hypothetical protein
MEKLRLKLEELTVQSFPTDDADSRKGTVQGQEGAPSALYTHCCNTDEFQSCPFRCTP